MILPTLSRSAGGTLHPYSVGLLATLAISLLAGCGADPYAAEYTRNKPDQADLVGPWRLLRFGHEQHALRASDFEIHADGTFASTNMPKPNRDGTAVIYESAQGTWELLQHRKRWAVRFTWQRDGSTRAHTFLLRGESAPYYLHLTLGAPDEGRALVFTSR